MTFYLRTLIYMKRWKEIMKKSLTEYASALSGSSIDCLEEIVGKKYKKFIRFYDILKDQSEYIKKMEYLIYYVVGVDYFLV